MRAIRAVLAIVTCTAALVAMTGVASAGISPVTSSITATCNADTGMFDISVVLTNIQSGSVTVSDGVFEALDIDDNEVAKGLLTFAPASVPAGSTSSVAFMVPGDTYEVYVQWDVEFFTGDNDSLFIEKPCTLVPTTTVPDETTTTVADTPTTAAPAVAAAAAPRFTG